MGTLLDRTQGRRGGLAGDTFPRGAMDGWHSTRGRGDVTRPTKNSKLGKARSRAKKRPMMIRLEGGNYGGFFCQRIQKIEGEEA